MSETDDLLEHFRRHRRWTRELVEAIPEEHFDWAPAESTFSCGQLVRHLMQAETFWRHLLASALDGEEYDPFHMEGPGEERMRRFRAPNLQASGSPKLGESVAECLEAWLPIQEKTEALLASLTSEQLAQVRMCHPLTRLEGSLRQGVILMLEHEAHHRGQLSAYLKSLGVDLPATLWT